MPRSRHRLWSSFAKILLPKKGSARGLAKFSAGLARLWTPVSKPLEGHTTAGRMVRRYVMWEGQRRGYLLYEPPLAAGVAPKLLVALHGCKQTAADFARGTRLNEVAARHGYAVAYPEQTRAANRLQCWNWFERRHQGTSGESAMLAALTLDAARKSGASPTRIFVAGLSAGGAMALVLARAYPALYAGVGCHSGVPAGVASDVFSAMRIMRDGPGRPAPEPGDLTPIIVFHGLQDRTVNPRNGELIVAAALKTAERLSATPLVRSQDTVPASSGGSGASVLRFARAEGDVLVESWTIQASGHAWFGGAAEGSFTDPAAPDASEALLTFFDSVQSGASYD